MPTLAKDIEVEMTFLRPEEGGRSTPCYTGYRPQFYYDGIDSDAIHTYIDTEVVNPGQTVRAYLTFFVPDYHLGKVKENMEFFVREGSRTVAKGRVIKILELEKSAAEALKRKAQKPA
ncbi:MAG: elongation factor Tu [Verrucomicrobiota bacterium]